MFVNNSFCDLLLLSILYIFADEGAPAFLASSHSLISSSLAPLITSNASGEDEYLEGIVPK